MGSPTIERNSASNGWSFAWILFLRLGPAVKYGLAGQFRAFIPTIGGWCWLCPRRSHSVLRGDDETGLPSFRFQLISRTSPAGQFRRERALVQCQPAIRNCCCSSNWSRGFLCTPCSFSARILLAWGLCIHATGTAYCFYLAAT
jgi:hypothetical protein